jgi:hypothetical protein
MPRAEFKMTYLPSRVCWVVPVCFSPQLMSMIRAGGFPSEAVRITGLIENEDGSYGLQMTSA